MGLRRKSRELALQFLFSFDVQSRLDAPAEEIAAAFSRFSEHFISSNAALPYAQVLVEGVCHHYQDLDKRIAAHSHRWRVERMSVVDRTILRIAAYELSWAEDAPAQVVINEALEIAKRYSIDDSAPFINGILDGMHGARQRQR
ncbi:MAG: transcription antitermination factor NusB [Desulfobulbaceae bacterium]|nr:transcription antitermination factor NusB [Desulfobulbaceae bacterium]